MATNNQKAAPAEEQQVTKTEAFFEKYKKAKLPQRSSRSLRPKPSSRSTRRPS